MNVEMLSELNRAVEMSPSFLQTVDDYTIAWILVIAATGGAATAIWGLWSWKRQLDQQEALNEFIQNPHQTDSEINLNQ